MTFVAASTPRSAPRPLFCRLGEGWPRASQIRRIPNITLREMTKAARSSLVPLTACLTALAGAMLGTVRYEPGLHAWREHLLWVILGTSLTITIAMGLRLWTGSSAAPPIWLTRLRVAAFVSAILSLALTSAVEAKFQSMRERVIAAPAAELGEVGRHVIVGVDEFPELSRLVEKGAAAGVFFTRRNVKGRNAAFLKREIEDLQRLQAARGGDKLWVTADQEGGVVQRLSPPLPRQPALASVVKQHKEPAAQEVAVREYAARQGKALASLGINVNFAPVVDVDFGISDRRSGYSRISRRAISADPAIVAQTANCYCDALRKQGVRCTKKHFPGLGRLSSDTHVREASLGIAIDKLSAFDWVPFNTSASGNQDWIMLGHVRVTALDPERPASASAAVVEKLRKDLGHTGIIVTDDFSMGAIRKSKLGVGQAAVASLNAGVDLVLVSFDPDQIYVVLDALLTARQNGQLDKAKLRESSERLKLAAEAQAAGLAN